MKTELLSLNQKENATLTMSSVEIAQLCEKRHDHVMVDIRKMLDELDLNAPDFSGTYKTTQGNEYQCFLLPKREVMILVSGYRIDLRARIIDRLNELEQKQLTQLPSYSEALRQLADKIEESEQKSIQIASMESYFRNGISPFEFVKGLNGVNYLKVGAFLVDKNWLYQDGNHKCVKSYARDQYLTEETTEISQHGKDPFVAYKPVLLKKGAAKLYEWYTKRELPMKANWNGVFTQDKVVGL